MKLITLRVHEKLYKLIEEHIEKFGMTKSEFIRGLLYEWANRKELEKYERRFD